MDEEVIAPIQKYLKGETRLTMMYQAYKLSYHYLAQIVKSYMKLLSQILILMVTMTMLVVMQDIMTTTMTMITTTTTKVITSTTKNVPYESNTGSNTGMSNRQ